MSVLRAVHVSEPEVQRALVAGGVLAPLEAWLADAVKGGKDALVVAEVRSLATFVTAALLGLHAKDQWRIVASVLHRWQSGCAEHRPDVLPHPARRSGCLHAERDAVTSAQSVLKRLGELPVDTAALQACSIGRTMNRLKKAGPEGLREDAAALVAKWKRVVDAESASAAALTDGAAKRDRCALI